MQAPAATAGGAKATPKPTAAAGPAKYNSMAPPTTAYTADMAVALATAAMEGAAPPAPVSVLRTWPYCMGMEDLLATGRLGMQSVVMSGRPFMRGSPSLPLRSLYALSAGGKV